jgi:hypothetical protein
MVNTRVRTVCSTQQMRIRVTPTRKWVWINRVTAHIKCMWCTLITVNITHTLTYNFLYKPFQILFLVCLISSVVCLLLWRRVLPATKYKQHTIKPTYYVSSNKLVKVNQLHKIFLPQKLTVPLLVKRFLHFMEPGLSLGQMPLLIAT